MGGAEMKLTAIILSIILLYFPSARAVLAEELPVDEEVFSTTEEDSSDGYDIFSAVVKTPSDPSKKLEHQGLANKARIVALNKVTAKSKEMIISSSEEKYFGNIQIKIHQCIPSTDPYYPDNTALLTVTENKLDDDSVVIFQGWMSSANLSVATFEHPVYFNAFF